MLSRARRIINLLCALLALALATSNVLASPCDAFRSFGFRSPHPSDLAVRLKRYTAAATWDDVKLEDRNAILKSARAWHHAYDQAWGRAGLLARLEFVQRCDTAPKRKAIDAYLSRQYLSGAPFVLDQQVTRLDLRRALQADYLLGYADLRGTLAYPTSDQQAATDIDGKSPFDSYPFPSPKARAALAVLGRSTAKSLATIQGIPGLTPTERRLAQRAYFHAAFLGFRGDAADPCVRRGWGDNIPWGYEDDRPAPFGASQEKSLEMLAASWYGGVALAHLDIGTGTAADSNLCDRSVAADIDSLSDRTLAASMQLLAKWQIPYSQQQIKSPLATYSPEERADAWHAFLAWQSVSDPGGEPFAPIRELLRSQDANYIAHYQELAHRAVDLTLPESVLPPAARANLHAFIATQTTLFDLPGTLEANLRRSGNAPAADQWAAAVREDVRWFGGKPSIDADEKAALEAWHDKLITWVDGRYGKALSARLLLEKQLFSVTLGENQTTSASGISFGIKLHKLEWEYVSTMLHEFRHAVRARKYADAKPEDRPSIAADVGYVNEGSGQAVEEMLFDELLQTYVADERQRALITLSRARFNARQLATTAIFLDRFERVPCAAGACPDAHARAVTLAAKYGLDAETTEYAYRRANAGLQYLQYLYGAQVLEQRMAQLEPLVHAPVKLDPFILFECNANEPQPDDSTYVKLLDACVHEWNFQGLPIHSGAPASVAAP